MAFTSAEILALIVAILIVIKLAILSINSKLWWKIVKPLYSKGLVLFLVELVLAGVVFWYLLKELTIVQIMACILLGALLTGMSFAIWAKEASSWIQKLLKANVLKKAWLVFLIWLALAVWVLLELFEVI
ncbi:unnamed protein product [marine sediment metagenome]|uniref:Uncharacterized protein n=1 Tax=marine sediment metagenome TaxID=412755 RepID=X1UQ46_9ZZZZ